MEKEEQTRLVKITMPRTFANRFVEECRLNYNNSRWLKVKFDSAMVSALYMSQPGDIKERINEVRDELKNLIREFYGVKLK